MPAGCVWCPGQPRVWRVRCPAQRVEGAVVRCCQAGCSGAERVRCDASRCATRTFTRSQATAPLRQRHPGCVGLGLSSAAQRAGRRFAGWPHACAPPAAAATATLPPAPCRCSSSLTALSRCSASLKCAWRPWPAHPIDRPTRSSLRTSPVRSSHHPLNTEPRTVQVAPHLAGRGASRRPAAWPRCRAESGSRTAHATNDTQKHSVRMLGPHTGALGTSLRHAHLFARDGSSRCEAQHTTHLTSRPLPRLTAQRDLDNQWTASTAVH